MDVLTIRKKLARGSDCGVIWDDEMDGIYLEETGP
jgi:hypothetical protein